MDPEGLRHEPTLTDVKPEGAPSAGSAEGEAPKAPKIIKRYTNRKLYDTVESRYVTLDEIAEMVKAGVEVQILDNRSKEDLTSVTLAQIIFEEEKKSSKMPLGMLRDIIRTGSFKITAFVADEVTSRVSAIKEGAEHAMARVLRREEATADQEQAKEFVRSSRRLFDEWQKNLEERVAHSFQTVTGLPTLHREVQALKEKLSELEKKLEEHEPK